MSDRSHHCTVAAAAFLVLATLLLPGLAPAAQGETETARLAEADRAFRAGDVDSAVAIYRSLLAADPQRVQVRFQLANVLAHAGRWAEAADEFAAVAVAAPQNSLAQRGRATALLLAGRYAAARQALEDGLTALPQDGQLAHLLARLLATAPADEVRDGDLAVELAESVYEVVKIPQTAETLAMAYAEQGNFARAVDIQRQLIAGAEKAGEDTATLETLRLHLVAYLRQEPWRAASGAEIAQATPPPAAPEAPRP